MMVRGYRKRSSPTCSSLSIQDPHTKEQAWAAIAREVVEMHRGEISVKNNAERGCTFYISLLCFHESSEDPLSSTTNG